MNEMKEIIIRPDYKTPLEYPKGSQPLYSEDSGPTEYNLLSIELVRPAAVISEDGDWFQAYPYLLRKGLLGRYLGLRDGRELMKLSIGVFGDFCEGRGVLLPKGAILCRGGYICVPSIFFATEGWAATVVNWVQFDICMHIHRHAARFKNPQK